MTATWNHDQILALAPDAASAKAGKGLASPSKWGGLGRSAEAVWGECKGSGSQPYRTAIDLGEPAFRCSCPSRKFPCKHGIGLFLLLTAQPALLVEAEAPEWVATWLSSRAEKAVRAAKKAEAPPPTADPAAQAKRERQREGRIAAGLEEADRWLCDVVRGGLAAAMKRPYSFWEGMAARMVDAQAPGVARAIRDLASLSTGANSGPEGVEHFLEGLARLHLLLEGGRRLESLSPPRQQMIRTHLGWAIRQEELAEAPAVADRWLVVGRWQENDSQNTSLRIQRLWLVGAQSHRTALLLSFAQQNGHFDVQLAPGTAFDGELAFYPGPLPQRAVIRTRTDGLAPFGELPGAETIAAAWGRVAETLAEDPWRETVPMGLAGVVPLHGGAAIRDGEGHLLPLSPIFREGWHLMALSGGYPITIFGEWHRRFFLPLSVWAEGRFHAFLQEVTQ